MADATTSSVWAARLAKELSQLQPQPGQLPKGVTRDEEGEEDVSLEEGRCRLRFRLAKSPPETGVVVVEVELGHTSTNYPFEPPVLTVLSGQELLLPQANVSATTDGGRIVLPALTNWTPNTGVLDLLVALSEALERGEEEGGGGMTDTFEPGQALDTAKFPGPLFPCSLRLQGGAVLHRYLGVLEDWVLLVEADKTRLEWVTVVRAASVLQVAKLKYRRGESISVILKDGSKWELQMPASADCVQAVQGALAKKGVQGRKTSQAAINQEERARLLILEARRREEEVDGDDGWSQERVQGIVDLYKDAVEMLASVSDEKTQTQEVMALLHAFLRRPDVQAVLDQPRPPPPLSTRSSSSSDKSSALLGSLVPAGMKKSLGQLLPVRKGEVLPRAESELYSQEDDGLAREERNMLQHGLGQLRRRLSGGGEEGEARQRAGSAGLDLSASVGSAGSAGGEVAEAGAREASHSLDATLQDLEAVLAEATSEFEKLSSPEKRAEEGVGEQGAASGAASAAAAAAAVAGHGGGNGNGTEGAEERGGGDEEEQADKEEETVV